MKNRYEIDAGKRYAKQWQNERKWSPNGSQNPLKINKNPFNNEVRKSMSFWGTPRARTGPRRRAQRQPNINKIPSEKQQERKQSAENLSEDKLNELRRKTVGKIDRRIAKRRNAKVEYKVVQRKAK